MQVRVTVTLKNGVLDPQGKAIEHALENLDFSNVQGVRQSKLIEFDLEETNPEKAQSQVKAMCEQLLANTVIENYTFEFVEDGS